MPSAPSAKRPRSRSHMVYIDDSTWERLTLLAFHSSPRRSVSDVIREMVEVELPKFERNGVQK